MLGSSGLIRIIPSAPRRAPRRPPRSPRQPHRERPRPLRRLRLGLHELDWIALAKSVERRRPAVAVVLGEIERVAWAAAPAPWIPRPPGHDPIRRPPASPAVPDRDHVLPPPGHGRGSTSSACTGLRPHGEILLFLAQSPPVAVPECFIRFAGRLRPIQARRDRPTDDGPERGDGMAPAAGLLRVPRGRSDSAASVSGRGSGGGRGIAVVARPCASRSTGFAGAAGRDGQVSAALAPVESRHRDPAGGDQVRLRTNGRDVGRLPPERRAGSTRRRGTPAAKPGGGGCRIDTDPLNVTKRGYMEGKRRAWTPVEDRRIREAARAVQRAGRGRSPGFAELALELGRTVVAVRKRASRLAVRRYRWKGDGE